MYLDDGLGGADEISQAHETSIVVQKVLKASGFLIAEDKCNWTPSQNVVWLGLVWQFDKGMVSVTERRLSKLLDTLNRIIHKIGKGEIHVSARFLASIIGQIISMQGAVGPVVRLRTRSMYECILYKASWNAHVLLNGRSLDEIIFWKENIEKNEWQRIAYC
ncbi:Hypothetical predicted protein [Mytilus galloprovincialis]|uniref:Reverse transcriptase domain-containing protein n=1 Tax=Mytilus galloprovincialis TaxID=29158 RepID=A0A8B6DW22_MYTGA|nr:Hypothetical predicted protein [Mytilus galloprovincialis]